MVGLDRSNGSCNTLDYPIDGNYRHCKTVSIKSNDKKAAYKINYYSWHTFLFDTIFY